MQIEELIKIWNTIIKILGILWVIIVFSIMWFLRKELIKSEGEKIAKTREKTKEKERTKKGNTRRRRKD